MNNVLIVALRECLTLLRRPSFYASLLLGPAIVVGIFFGFSMLNDEFGEEPAPEQSLEKPAGYVDQAGVITSVPDPLQAFFIAYPDEPAAAAALRSGMIGSYFVVPSAYRGTGEVVRVGEQATFTSGSAPDSRMFRALLRINLATDPLLAQRLDLPPEFELELVNVTAGSGAKPAGSDGSPFGLPTVLGLLLALSIVNGGGWLVQAVSEEKENRTIEIVLTSLRPLQLMTGKLLGLGAVALLQLVIWLGVSRGAMSGASGLGSLSIGNVPAELWLWVIVYFLLGFLMFGGIMLALGAVGASARETGQITGLLTLPVVAPLWFAPSLSDNPGGLLAVVLSIFPVTAPVTMTMRLADGAVPAWHLLLCARLLFLGVLGSVFLAARLFRGTTLLTGVRPTPRALWRALRAG
ncbi:MAG TPA: ABC transporter permease [Herpetosiphonaceae bacterium]|nr:ABC transporter permease [Herpetosiphonaceae bacterium]